MRAMLLAPLLAALPVSVLAEPLTYEAAIARAAADAPSLRARALEADARRASVPPAGELPDPRLGVGIENFPVSGPPAFSLTGDNMTMARIGVSQDIPNPAKRHARTARAEADVGEAEAMWRAELRRVRVEAASAWMDLAFAERRLKAIDIQIGLVQRLRSGATATVASGSARPAQTLDVRRTGFALADRRSGVAAEVGRARALLARWTGDVRPEIAGSIPAIEIDPEALRNSVDAIPSLELLSARVRQSEVDVRLARADKRPDLAVELAYQQRAERYGNMVSAGVTVGLPLFASRRQNPVIAARSATASAALAEREDARRSLAAELEEALADHVMHHEQWMRAVDDLLPLAKQRADLETASYGAGRASLLDVIDARMALAEAELEVLDREAMVARDAVRLTLIYGSEPR